MTFDALRHTVRTGCFHCVKQKVFVKVLRRGRLSLFQLCAGNAALAFRLHIREDGSIILFAKKVAQ